MSDTFYPAWYVLDGGKRCFIKQENVEELYGGKERSEEAETQFRVVTDMRGKMAIFRTLPELRIYAQRGNIDFTPNALEKEVWDDLYNFDVVLRWLKRPKVSGMPCRTFLNAWNILDDIARTVDSDAFYERVYDDWDTLNVYGKVVEGCNLFYPQVTRKKYTPTWSRREIHLLRKNFVWSLNMLRANIALPSAET